MTDFTIPTINIRAIERPDYLNASDRFETWVTQNVHRLEYWFVQCGGDLRNTAEYLEFACSQFDMQQVSQLDIKLLNEVREENEQRRARDE